MRNILTPEDVSHLRPDVQEIILELDEAIEKAVVKLTALRDSGFEPHTEKNGNIGFLARIYFNKDANGETWKVKEARVSDNNHIREYVTYLLKQL